MSSSEIVLEAGAEEDAGVVGCVRFTGAGFDLLRPPCCDTDVPLEPEMQKSTTNMVTSQTNPLRNKSSCSH